MVKIEILAQLPEGPMDLRSLDATMQSLNHWAIEEFGQDAAIGFSLVDEEPDEEEEQMLNEARYGRLGQDS